MADDALIAETNRLLAQVLQIQEEQRAEGERALKEIEESSARTTAEFEEQMRKRLEAKGLSPEALEGDAQSWETRREEAVRRSHENLKTLRARDETYRDELLTELRVQSNLLRTIADRLDR